MLKAADFISVRWDACPDEPTGEPVFCADPEAHDADSDSLCLCDCRCLKSLILRGGVCGIARAELADLPSLETADVGGRDLWIHGLPDWRGQRRLRVSLPARRASSIGATRLLRMFFNAR